ncbi:CDP-alcohol phosphatidyltransferase family protein [Candidatus Micrarchaeota archaeon]|nr:CDP-alcohol phosphatidyltransferase family protein [Candidatus Micrarchaeota archaeon]
MLKERIGEKTSDVTYMLFGWIPLTPNQLTIGAVLIALIGLFIWDYSPVLSILLFGFAFFIDMIDGAIARGKGISSPKGAFLDGISDRTVEFLLILLFIRIGLPPFIIGMEWWLIGILFLGTAMTSYIKAYSSHCGVLGNEEAKKMPGMLERAERIGLLFIGLLLVLWNANWASFVLVVVFFLAGLTVVQRIAFVMNAGKGYKKELGKKGLERV